MNTIEKQYIFNLHYIGHKVFIIISILLAPLWGWAQSDVPLPFLSIEIGGNTRIIITDPEGNRTGSQGYEVHKASDNAHLVLAYGKQSISYAQPVLGKYELDLKGRHNEVYELVLAWYDGTQYEHQSYRFYAKAESSRKLDITLEDVGDGRWRVSSPSFEQVSAQIGRSEKDESTVWVSWQALEGVRSYYVYAKESGAMQFERILSTEATSSATGIPWGADAKLGPSYLAVSAVLENGRETALSLILATDDSDGDGYSDDREEARGTNPYARDSDGDGVDDFLEINRFYSDPLNQDSDGDDYSDGEEVNAGTLPNSDRSYPGVGQECAPPAQGDWEVHNDCTVVESDVIPADLIVFPKSILSIARGVTLWFDYLEHSILVLFGGGIKMAPDARIEQH
ncbi:MAG: hypothetical protein ACKKL4_02825 [Patescibacteria group bacterium]